MGHHKRWIAQELAICRAAALRVMEGANIEDEIFIVQVRCAQEIKTVPAVNRSRESIRSKITQIIRIERGN